MTLTIALSFLAGFVVYFLIWIVKSRRSIRCDSILSGIHMQCLLDKGHSGPHVIFFKKNEIWFKDGDRLSPREIK